MKRVIRRNEKGETLNKDGSVRKTMGRKATVISAPFPIKDAAHKAFESTSVLQLIIINEERLKTLYKMLDTLAD